MLSVDTEMKSKTEALLLLSIGVSLSVSMASIAMATTPKKCARILTKSYSDSTSNFIAYFEQMLERQILGDRELLRFISNLKQDQLKNPIRNEEAEINSTLQIHRGEIEEYLENTILDKKEILEWAQNALAEKERIHEKRDEIKEVTKVLYQKMEFHPVPVGSFSMGEEGKKVEVKLTHPFEVMSTQVTQKHWVDLMRENPSHFKDGDSTITAMIDGKPIKMQPDHPVENITWWSAIVFANKLSEKHGLIPAYDLSEIKFNKLTKAENGTLRTQSEFLKINNQANDIYQTTGYRLPTEAEQEYLLRAVGKANGIYYFGDNKKEIKEHAWVEENSNGMTHAVAGLKPLIINGKEFYDLLGNVWEWGYDGKEPLMGGENPVGGYFSFNDRVLRGGCAVNHGEIVSSQRRFFMHPSTRTKHYGFRLVRSLP